MPAGSRVRSVPGPASKGSLRPRVRRRSYALAYFSIAAFLILAHGPLLRLPFYWDEIGQFIPASLDLFHAGALIPVSTVPNVHPPGLMAYLALFWTLFGYSIPGTRIAMLIVAAAGALITFLLAIELSRGSRGTPAFTALVLLCISPLFFAQSMLAQLDMPAMCLTLLAILLFLQKRIPASAMTCAALVIVKETGLVIPAVLAAWTLFENRGRARLQALWFLLPVPGIAIWLIGLHRASGHWLGNSQFASYNVFEQLRPAAFFLAFARRFYYLFISTGHFIGSIALICAARRTPLLHDRPWRIAASVVLAHAIAVSALGGAVLERYLLPALPIVYIAFAISLAALTSRARQIVTAGLFACLAAANFINPPYPFPFENNLAFASFVELEHDVAGRIGSLPNTRVVTAFPVADALRNPDYGFTTHPGNVVTIEDFGAAEVAKVLPQSPDFLVYFPRQWDPLHLLQRPAIRHFLEHHYGYKPDLTTDEIAATLSMRVAGTWTRRGLTMSLLERAR
jgi:hypothetical protein